MRYFLKNFFKRKQSIISEEESVKKFLVVGLGNIGAEYEGTRHNVGFQIVDSLATARGFTFASDKLGDIGTFKVKGRQIFCLKPSTYMNRSGKALKYWQEKEKVPLENLLVIADDINLPFGTLRLKTKGSDGGHNGLKDIQHTLQTTNYNRLRFGVGSEFNKGRQVDYVLGKWSEEEHALIGERLEIATAIIESFVLAGPKLTMNQFNGS